MNYLRWIHQVTTDMLAYGNLFYKTVLDLNAKLVLELGTDVGDSTRIFAEALLRTGGRLITVDIQGPKSNWNKDFYYPNVTYVISDSLDFNINEPIDILFVDDHFDGENDLDKRVFEELERFGTIVKKGGMIFIDDINHSNLGPMIKKATLEWVQKYSYPYSEIQENHWLGMIHVK